MSTSETNSIERSILINASREKVWRALSNAEQFGMWFGVDLTGQTFIPGQAVRGLMNSNCGHENNENAPFEMVIDRIEPQDVFSYRWHPYSVDPTKDYAQEQKTLVTFTLTDGPDNSTLLTVLETGFDNIPLQRRAEAFGMHSQGWDVQLNNVARHASQ